MSELEKIRELIRQYRDEVRRLRLNLIGFAAEVLATEENLSKILQGEKSNGN